MKRSCWGLVLVLVLMAGITGCGGSNRDNHDDFDVSADLAAYYPLNGNANDVVGSNDPSAVGSTVSYTQDRFGNANSACLLDGTANGLISFSTITLDSGNGFALSLWLKNDSTKSNGHLVYSSVLDIYQDNTTTIGFTITSGTPVITVEHGFNENQWTHLVVTFNKNSGTGALYINGSRVGSQDASTIPSSINLNGFTIGTYWKGAIDDVRLYAKVLTDDEILQLYQYHNS